MTDSFGDYFFSLQFFFFEGVVIGGGCGGGGGSVCIWKQAYGGQR